MSETAKSANFNLKEEFSLNCGCCKGSMHIIKPLDTLSAQQVADSSNQADRSRPVRDTDVVKDNHDVVKDNHYVVKDNHDVVKDNHGRITFQQLLTCITHPKVVDCVAKLLEQSEDL